MDESVYVQPYFLLGQQRSICNRLRIIAGDPHPQIYFYSQVRFMELEV